jgi:acyl-CoA synthetase (AMP-forming)/AMP-acid ligase II/acyl carrier protein
MTLTIVERMREHAAAQPDAIAFRFLNDLTHAPQELTFAQLWREAAAVAAFLAQRAQPGERIMLFFPPGLAYIKAFYGCLLAGMVAVPLYPPRRNVKSDRVMNVALSCQAAIALTTASELAAVQGAWDEQNTSAVALDFYASDRIDSAEADAYCASAPALSAVAFLQYTSGSTGMPKGVIVTHDNIVANVKHMSLMSTGGENDVWVNWLPLFHDLGLVTAVLWPVYLGAPSVLMAPATFVRDPRVWLEAITRYRGTMCGAPNFAFDLCLEKVSAADLAGLDLSSWRVAYNAAEPVRADTLARFAERFGACGFSSSTFYPCYGMAEATVFVAGGQAAARPIVLSVDKAALAAMRVEPVPENDPRATRIVDCGAALAPHEVRIVDPDSARALPDGAVGEIWFRGPSVSPGYWQLEEVSRATFGCSIAGEEAAGGHYLRTGDLGTVVDGGIFVVGRIKDLVIVRGRNYYPQDIEASAGAAHVAVRSGCVAAFSVTEGEREQLVVVAELEREHFRSVDTGDVIGAIRQRVALDQEVAVDQVVLLRPYKIPMTSSGKIQRRQTRSMLADGSLETLAQSTDIAARALTAPVTETERRVCQAWVQILERPVGADENFFELGGDSLAAAEIFSLLGQQFPEAAIEPSQMLDTPTVQSLSQWIDLKRAHAAVRHVAPTSMKTITI